MRALVPIALLLGGVAQGASLAVVVRVAADADEALYQRVRGQTSDLDVSLDVERGALETGLAAQVEAARGLAEARGARVVVWFDASGEEIVVLVAEPASGRILARRLEAEGQRSARLEAAAQVVRSSLRALAAGGTIGVAAVEAVADAEGAPIAVASTAPPPAPPVPEEGLDWRASVGWQLGVDGASDPGGQGLAARVAFERGSLGLEVFAAAGAASRIEDDRATVELARHAVGIAGSYGWARGALRLAGGLAAGVVAWRRTTVARDPSLVPTAPTTTWSFAAGPELRGAWMFGAVGVELTLAADLVLPAPRLVYETTAGTEVLNDLSILQPRVGLALVVRTGD